MPYRFVYLFCVITFVWYLQELQKAGQQFFELLAVFPRLQVGSNPLDELD